MYKIAIIGPESTGKTELAKKLAFHYEAIWVPEYARNYMEQLTRPYTYDDVCVIARKQISEEKFFENENQDTKFVFFDTDLIITKVWFEFKYHTIPSFLVERLKEPFFDFYLLCTPDLPWIFDPVREHGDDRNYFFDLYRREIEQTGVPYVQIEGFGDSRLQQAIDWIDKHV